MLGLYFFGQITKYTSNIWVCLDFTYKSLVLLAKPHPPLVLVVKWHTGVLMCIYYFFLPNQAPKKNVFSLKTKSTTSASKVVSFSEADLANKRKNTH